MTNPILRTCAHPEHATTCITEVGGLEVHAHVCTDCMLDDNPRSMVGPRRLSDIAQDIRANWPKMSRRAKPYVDAMATLPSIDAFVYQDDVDEADTIVRYFLSNATTWRGEDARRIKAELKAMIA